MTPHSHKPKLSANSVRVNSEPLPPITLTGGLDQEELDALVPGQLYVLTSFSPPLRFALWVNLLRTAIERGRVCHMLIKTDPAEFLERLKMAGWPNAAQAWRNETLRLYHMADMFTKIIFRLDVEGLTAELSHWGVHQQHVLLVDAADEVLSLHDLSLSTSQTVKLKAWARAMKVSLLLNFNFANNPTVKTGLTGLMDHFTGLARLHAESDGPVLILEYWQSPTGTVAERALALELSGNGFRLRVQQQQQPLGGARPALGGHANSNANANALPSVSFNSHSLQLPAPTRTPHMQPAAPIMSHMNEVPECFTVDRVWARELQLLTGIPWNSFFAIEDLHATLSPSTPSIILLRFGSDTHLAQMAHDVYDLRCKFGEQMRLIVAELRSALRYAEELMLLRLGVDAIIRRDVPMERWPALLLSNARSPTRRNQQLDIDVDSAIASAASSHARGYLLIPDFLTEMQAAAQRGQELGVPFALAVLYPFPDRKLRDVVNAAEFRRWGDILTTDGEKFYMLLYACSITKGPAVLESIFCGRLSMMITSVEWMVSEADINDVFNHLYRLYTQKVAALKAIAT